MSKKCSETNFDLQTAGTATVLGAGYFGMSVELSSQSTRISENTNYIDDTCTRVSVTHLLYKECFHFIKENCMECQFQEEKI